MEPDWRSITASEKRTKVKKWDSNSRLLRQCCGPLTARASDFIDILFLQPWSRNFSAFFRRLSRRSREISSELRNCQNQKLFFRAFNEARIKSVDDENKPARITKPNNSYFIEVLSWGLHCTAFVKSLLYKHCMGSIFTVHELSSREKNLSKAKPRKYLRKISAEPKFEPRATGWEIQTLPLC